MDRLGQIVDVVHDNNHYPENEGEENWQESWAFSWYDPVKDVGGWGHLSMQRTSGLFDMNSSLTRRGQVIGRYQCLGAPLPDGDFTDLTAGPIRIRSLEPLVKHQVSHSHDRAQAEVTMLASVGPLWMGHRDAHQHWESFGRVSGQVEHDGETIDVSGFAFHDRSWGSRDYASLHSLRIFTAIFGDDLIFRLFEITRPEGVMRYGYIRDKGVIHPVAHIDSSVGMSGDGVEPRSANVAVWTQSGLAYRLSGQARDAEVMTRTAPWMTTHSNMLWDCGGRIGTGFLQVAELKLPAAWHLERLGVTNG